MRIDESCSIRILKSAIYQTFHCQTAGTLNGSENRAPRSRGVTRHHYTASQWTVDERQATTSCCTKNNRVWEWMRETCDLRNLSTHDDHRRSQERSDDRESTRRIR